MDREPVVSSNLASVGYCPESSVLEVEFCSGAVYVYWNVPARVHSALMRAPSHGSYFSANVRTRYDYQQIRRG
jgi:hypothetical protein